MLSHIRTAASKTWLPALAVLTTIVMLTAKAKTQQSVLLMGVNGGAPVAISANATGQLNTTVASGGGTFTSSVAINGSGSQLTFNTNGTAAVPNILFPTAGTGIYSTGANVAFTISSALSAFVDVNGLNLAATSKLLNSGGIQDFQYGGTSSVRFDNTNTRIVLALNANRVALTSSADVTTAPGVNDVMFKKNGNFTLAIRKGDDSTDGILTAADLQTISTTVASLPTCNAGNKGLRAFVSDQNTAVAYHGAVTGGGATNQAVTCDGTSYYQS